MCTEGVCINCGWQDPDYVHVFAGTEIVSLLISGKVSDTGGLSAYTGADKISVFAEDRTDAVGVSCGVDYNIWGINERTSVYNITTLGENAELLKFNVGGKTGSAGPMRVEFFLDKTVTDASVAPDIAFDIEASDIPSSHSIRIGGHKMLTMRVTNMCVKENTLVLYDFATE